MPEQSRVFIGLLRPPRLMGLPIMYAMVWLFGSTLLFLWVQSWVVAVFADRADITEEVVRLASHLDQFHAFIHEPESSGRKLEFVTQEMFREANTIASKAGDIEISRCAVEIKAALERIRELVQNVE